MPEWTENDRKRLSDLWLEKTPKGRPANTAEVIATLLHRSRNAIIGRAHRDGLPKRASGGSAGRTPVPKYVRKPKPPNWHVGLSQPKQRVAPTPPAPPERRDGGVPFMELQSHHCRWIIGTSSDRYGLATYCGITAKEGSYCEEHAKRCYTQYMRR